MTEQELLVDCLGRLNRVGITYYLTGSMASNYWGIPRTTHDLDFEEVGWRAWSFAGIETARVRRDKAEANLTLQFYCSFLA